MFNLPIAFLAGLRVVSISENECTTSIPFKWLNKNPFKSMYFAVQSMAAELSTAINCQIATKCHEQSIAFIIIDCKANFLKKADGKVLFTCSNANEAFDAVNECSKSGETSVRTFLTTGTTADGTVVSNFEFTWSFKARKS
ncbi:MAG: DUF4442 domain-containing protein [Cyclobacteriaceae bacterium]